MDDPRRRALQSRSRLVWRTLEERQATHEGGPCDAHTASGADAGAGRGSRARPGPAALRAGAAYEQKLDGHRALLFTAAGAGGTVLAQSRRGARVQDRWPDQVAAAEAQLPYGLVLDGELVVWDAEAGRLSFEALQRRAATRARGALALAARWPVHFVAFDLLQR
ncbi:ATP-dependent DNA ligase [Streptomyces erythrochromogenes]|uniref:ATP-dependent DNA ligase n=1 Tax=Streptomyces erythrochromogenes TaxID=285574 RepID=UPI003696CD58